MKKLIKTIILLPMWPLIWIALYTDFCPSCGIGWPKGCHRRAEKMLAWWRS